MKKLAAAALLLNICLAGLARAQDAPKPTWRFRLGSGQEHLELLGKHWFVIKLDVDGRFVFQPYGQCADDDVDRAARKKWAKPGEVAEPYLGPWPEVHPLSRNWGWPCFEYRSGSLIAGKTVMNISRRGFTFEPKVGAEIIDFDEHKHTPDVLSIYNLPGLFLWDNAEQIREARRRGLPDPPGEPKHYTPGLPVFNPTPRIKPFVKPSKEAYVSLRMHDKVHAGFVDEDGTFVPDIEIPVLEGADVKSPFPDLTAPRSKGERVFEYRCGRLVPGKLDQAKSDGSTTFIPEVGAKVIEHQPDLPALKERRVYNMPFHLRK